MEQSFLRKTCQAVDSLTASATNIATPLDLHITVNSPCINIMASRSFSKVLTAPLARQFVSPAAQRRTFVSALGGVRASIASSGRAAFAGQTPQVRGVKTIDFAGHKETVFGKSGADGTCDYGGLQ